MLGAKVRTLPVAVGVVVGRLDALGETRATRWTAGSSVACEEGRRWHHLGAAEVNLSNQGGGGGRV